MSVWFTSDLHLGHYNMAIIRGFNSTQEHDEYIIRQLQKYVNKKDKLFILGDVAWKKEQLQLINEVNGYKELIFGNHDKLYITEYLKVFQKIHGFRNYKDYWLSHCPVHFQEIRRSGNIHGHIHKCSSTALEDNRYKNVNIDMNEMKPVNFEDIKSDVI